MTALVLVLFDLTLGEAGHAASLALLHERIIDTLVGSVVALLCMLLFNPQARRHLLTRFSNTPTE
ncbi:hypothetical protein CSQ89_00010 [Chitinimonas sp. BJB300]|nr:hypothetical protein CSQ89_00010 [Chitinimonas sp. BJB300]